MRKFNLLVIVVLAASAVNAEVITQTDWSFMTGILGPVSSYNWNYYYSENVVTLPEGQITLSEFSRNTVSSSLSAGKSVLAWDFDGDGDQDLLTAEWYGDKIRLWENTDGSGTSWTPHLVDEMDFIWRLHLVDINNDGYLDIVGAPSSPGYLWWWSNDDGSGLNWTVHSIDGQFYTPNWIDSGDIDQDGDSDLLAAGKFDNNIWWWENHDSGSYWTRNLISGNWYGAYTVQACDMDSDGDLDVMTAGEQGVVWWSNDDGSGTAWTKITVDPTNECECASIDDFDADGDIDITGADGAEVFWWENLDASGTQWTRHVISDSGFHSGFRALSSGDVDMDGTPDVVAAGWSNNFGICFWSNTTGTGLAWDERVVNSTDGGNGICIADINGDSSNDVITTGGVNLTWWDFTAFATSGNLVSSILDLGSDSDWSQVEWTSSEPSGTDVSIQLRASDDYNDMGAWSDTIHVPGSIEEFLNDYTRYFQYKVILCSTDTSITPVFEEINVYWTSLGIQEGEELLLSLIQVTPNPSSGSANLHFTVLERMPLSISVFGISGRVVYQVAFSDHAPGTYQFALPDLIPGVYLCRISSGEHSSTQAFTITD